MYIKKALPIILFALMTAATVAQEFKVMTYNIRLNTASDGGNAWPVRRDFLADQIKFYAPGVFGVQEALPEQMKYLKEQLADYAFIGDGRDGKGKGEYSAIFYDKTKFKVSREGMFWLSTTPNKVSKSWDAALPRICTYGLFTSRKGNKKFWMFNTHFDHVGQEARVNSAKLILDKIAEVNTKNLPVILTGDFNVEPDNEVFATLSRKLNDSRASALLSFGNTGTFNGFEHDEAVTRRIDYIFTSKEGIMVLKNATLTDAKDQKYPSDHFPVLMEFELNK